MKSSAIKLTDHDLAVIFDTNDHSAELMTLHFLMELVDLTVLNLDVEWSLLNLNKGYSYFELSE